VDQNKNMSNNNLESLMRDVARAVQTDARRKQLLPEIQARMAALDAQSRRSQRSYGWRLPLAGAAACAAGIAFFVLRPSPVSFVVDGAGAGRTGAVGERLVASESAPLPLRFSDGSQVTLPPRAQAHVDALDKHGATVALDEGTVEVAVVHRSRTRWSIRAGRYEIRVTGTKFSADWDRRTDALTVTMREGSVEVIGPGMKAPARVVGGQRLRANGVTADGAGAPEVVVEDAAARTIAAREEAAVPEIAPEALEAPVAAEAEQPEAADKSAPAGARAGSRARRAVAPPAPKLVAIADTQWHALETKGRYKEALAAAKSERLFDDNCARLAGPDMVRLADTARLAGDLERADYAYQSARRFPASAAGALYGLGRVAFDQRHDYAAAASWFQSYVNRFPNGPMAKEAAGLLLESRLNAGDNAGARDAAGIYLRINPHGPLASKARAIQGH
jgi:ferric-dicitrate binding protein FerR (iron transport regulator)